MYKKKLLYKTIGLYVQKKRNIKRIKAKAKIIKIKFDVIF